MSPFHIWWYLWYNIYKKYLGWYNMKSKTQRIHEINNLFDESNLPIHLVNDEDGVKAIINNERECTFQFSPWTTPDSMKNIVALANDLYNINPEYVSLIKHLSADKLLTFDRIDDTMVPMSFTILSDKNVSFSTRLICDKVSSVSKDENIITKTSVLPSIDLATKCDLGDVKNQLINLKSVGETAKNIVVDEIKQLESDNSHNNMQLFDALLSRQGIQSDTFYFDIKDVSPELCSTVKYSDIGEIYHIDDNMVTIRLANTNSDLIKIEVSKPEIAMESVSVDGVDVWLKKSIYLASRSELPLSELSETTTRLRSEIATGVANHVSKTKESLNQLVNELSNLDQSDFVDLENQLEQ